MASQLDAADELVLFGVAFRQPAGLPADLDWIEKTPQVRLVRRRFPNRVLAGLGRMRLMGVESFTGELDLFFHTDFVYSPLLSTRSALLLYDLSFMRPDAGFHRQSFCAKVGARVRKALACAGGVVLPSESARKDLEHFFPDLKIPVCVVPLGGDHLLRSFVRDEADVIAARPYFLSVGAFEPRKNRLRLLRAFEEAAAEMPETDLVMLGPAGWLDSPFQKALAASPAGSRIHLPGLVDDPLLRRYYEGAIALVYPSLEEGFGLPVAEAMALGCPVITSDRSSLPEVAGQAACLIDPMDEKALSQAMIRLVRDSNFRDNLIEAGKKRAAALTWQRTAAEILKFLRSRAVFPDRG
jgi:glycosyltransferase involved in cell wall biosynthesis